MHTRLLAAADIALLLDTVGRNELPIAVSNAAAHHPKRHDLTVVDSTGWAVEDEIALRLALELADRHDLGTSIALESIPVDPYDPYARPKKPAKGVLA